MKFYIGAALLLALSLSLVNCAKVRSAKSDSYVTLSLAAQFQDIMHEDRFTVEYGHFGASAADKSVLYTAVFNRETPLLMVNNSEYSADGTSLVSRCTLARSQGDFEKLDQDLGALVLGDQAQVTAGAGDTWISFNDIYGHTVVLFFDGSVSGGNGKKVIKSGAAMQALFKTLATCP